MRPTLLVNEAHPERREYAAQKEIDGHAALGLRMKEKAEAFVAAGGEIYASATASLQE